MVEKAREWVREAGRRPEDFGIEGACIRLASTDDDQRRRMLEGWRRLGATHVTLDTMGAHFESPQGHIDASRHFKEMAGFVEAGDD